MFEAILLKWRQFFADSPIHVVGELSNPQTWNDAPIKTGLLNFDARAS
jgi:hypothetical protein